MTRGRRPPRVLQVEAAAKVNVGWRVGPRREDGYHDVSGLLQTIDLSDRLEIAVEDEPGPLTVVVPGRPELEHPANLVHRAAAAVAERLADDPPATMIVLHKAIPVAAGLGGGSADAGATLVALSVAWGANLAVRELLDLGSRIGSDVPAIMVGGLVSVSGRGERVRGIGSFDDGWVVLGVGAEEAATATVYDLFDQTGAQPPATTADALAHNDLELAACELVPTLRERIDVMRKAAGVAFVSGSGPTVVGVATNEGAARDIASGVSGAFDDVLVARPCAWGVRLQMGT
jgi:4-diphosphocytidyl-2-C-methyl-D-erythritol kinase